MTLVFDACTVRYSWRRQPVLRGVSYALGDGLTILLGPNGAGKSTLLKAGASVLRPRSGSIRLGDIGSTEKPYRQRVAFMPQNITPMPSLTAREYVAYVGWLKGMNRRDAWSEAVRALATVGLTDVARQKTSHLSGGQLRRVGVAAALVHRADVLLLDEPTAGLDPRQRRAFRDVIRELAASVQVLMSTHDVADLTEEADHVAVMHAGEIVHASDTAAFLSLAAAGSAPHRWAETAYDALLTARGIE